MSTYYPTWQDANCAITLGFICETVAGVVPPTTLHPPYLPESLAQKMMTHGSECLEMRITAMHSSLLMMVTLL